MDDYTPADLDDIRHRLAAAYEGEWSTSSPRTTARAELFSRTPGYLQALITEVETLRKRLAAAEEASRAVARILAGEPSEPAPEASDLRPVETAAAEVDGWISYLDRFPTYGRIELTPPHCPPEAYVKISEYWWQDEHEDTMSTDDLVQAIIDGAWKVSP